MMYVTLYWHQFTWQLPAEVDKAYRGRNLSAAKNLPDVCHVVALIGSLPFFQRLWPFVGLSWPAAVKVQRP
jgi:hypothetical protein